MGTLVNAFAIGFGGLLGCGMQSRQRQNDDRTLSVGIMIISLVGFFQQIYVVEGRNMISENLIVVLLCYILGTKAGEYLHLEDKLSGLGKSRNANLNGFLDAAIFFGIGGLQFSGPVAWAINGDNSQLFIKSLVDLPFAVAFGATYGKAAALSAFPVAAVQLLIGLIAWLSADFFHEAMVAQLCAVGYIVLFFSGFNLIAPGRKISSVNILPGIGFVILYNVLADWTGIGL